jgi:hypothetical protein
MSGMVIKKRGNIAFVYGYRQEARCGSSVSVFS